MILAVVAFLVLRDAAGPYLAERVIARVLPLRGVQVDVDRVDFRGLGGVTLIGLRLRHGAGEVDGEAAIDTVDVRLAPAHLLRKPRRIHRVRVTGVRVVARQGPSGWPWAGLPWGAAREALEDTSQVSPSLVIERVELEQGAVDVMDPSGRLLLGASSLRASGSASLGEAASFSIDSMRVGLPASKLIPTGAEARARLSAAGGTLRIDTVEVTEGRGGRVGLTGSVRPGEGEDPDVDIRIDGSRVPVAQLHPSLAAVLSASARFGFEVTVAGPARRPRVTARVSPETSGGLRADGQVELTEAQRIADLHLDLDDVALAALLTRRVGVETVAGSVDARLDFTEPDSVDGRVAVDLRGTAGRPFRVAGHADFTRGTAQVEMDVASGPLRGRVEGVANPFGTSPHFDLGATGRMSLPLPRFVAIREPDLVGPWDATVRATGAGRTRETLDGTLDVRLSPVETKPRSGEIRVEGRIAGGELDFGTRMALGGGTVNGEGVVPLDNPLAEWRLTRLDVSGLDVEPWTGGGESSRLYVVGRARATPNGPSATMRVDSLVEGRLAGLTAEFDAERAGNRTHVRGEVARGTALVRIEDLELTGSAPSRVGVEFRNVDPGAVMPWLAEGGLSGRLDLAPPPTSTGPRVPTRLAEARLEGRLQLGESSLGGQPVAGGVDLRVEAGEAAFAAALEGVDQSLSVAGSVSMPGLPFTLHLREGRFSNLDVSSWLIRNAPSGRIDGTLAGTVAGFDPATAEADLAVTLGKATSGPFAVDTGTVSLRVGDGTATLRATAARGTRRAAVELEASGSPNGVWRGDGTARLQDSPAPDSSEALDLSLSFATPDTASGGAWRLRSEGGGVVLGTPLDSVELRVEMDDGVLTLDRLRLEGPEARMAGRGTLPLRRRGMGAADLAVDGSATDVGPLLASVGRPGYEGSMSVSLRSTGRMDDLQHDFRIGVSRLRGPRLEVDSLELRGTARSDSLSWIVGGAAEAVAEGIRPILLATGATPLYLGFGVPGPDGAAARNRIELAADWFAARSTVRLTRMAASLAGEEWRLERPANLEVSGRVAVDELRLRSEDGDGSVVAHGTLDRQGEQQFSTTIRGFPLYLGRRGAPIRLAGRMDLDVGLTGPAARPRLVADGRVEGPAGDPITVEADWTATRLQTSVRQVQQDGHRIALAGELPFGIALTGGPVLHRTEEPADVRVEIADFALAGLHPLLDPGTVEDLQGVINGQVHVAGAPRSLRLTGGASVSGFHLALQPYGTRLSADRLGVTLADNRATVTEGVIRSEGGGTLRLAGNVTLTELTGASLDLEATFDRFRAARSPSLDAVLSGSLTLGGTTASPRVGGRIHVDEASYALTSQELPSTVERVDLTEADYAELERRFGVVRDRRGSAAFRAWDPLALDLTVAMESNVWARRTFEPRLAVEVAGEVHVAKEPGGEPSFDGVVRIVPGRSFAEEFGRRFEIASGTVRLDGPPSNAELAVEATYDPEPDVRIRLNVEGNMEGYSITLGSDPPMDRGDIISYIAVGRRASSMQRYNELSGDVAGLGADIALSRLTGGLGELARRSLGLDVVEIRQDGLKGLTLVAGTYPARRLYVGFQQPVVFQGSDRAGYGISDTELDAEYRVNDWLLANLSGSRSIARFFLGARHAF